jgi:transcriptional regulator with XRE-family HTH domain
MDIHFALWLMRMARGLTQEQLSVRVHTSRQHISALEIFKTPTVATLFRLAAALDISPAVLLRIAESRTSLPPKIPSRSVTTGAELRREVSGG